MHSRLKRKNSSTSSTFKNYRFQIPNYYWIVSCIFHVLFIIVLFVIPESSIIFWSGPTE